MFPSATLSPLQFERGVQPLLPIDTIPELRDKRRDAVAKTVNERMEYLHGIRKMVYDTIVEAQSHINDFYNRHRRPSENFKIGQMVRIRLDGINYPKFSQRPCKKLNPVWYGPFEIIGRPSAVSVKLKLPPDTSIHDTHSVSKIKAATDDSFSGIDSTAPPVLEDIEGDYEVHKILDHDDRRDGRYYFLYSGNY